MTINSAGKLKTRTATLVGYHGYQNLGDDIFRRLVCQWLYSSFQIETIYISTKQDGTVCCDSQMQIVPFRSFFTYISRLLWLSVFCKSLKSKALIFSAGSIFTIQPFCLIYLTLRLLRLLRGNELRVLAIGVSIGPFHSSSDQHWCLKCLALMDYVLVRDSQSKLLIDESGHTINVHESFDLALCWGKVPTVPKLAGSVPILGLVVTERAFGTCTAEHSVNCAGMLQVVREMATEIKELRVRILCVCNDESDGDRLISQHVYENLSSPLGNALELIYYENDKVEEMLGLIAECSSLISARMHAGIMGTLASVPVYQISYADKIKEFYIHSELSTQYLADHTNLSHVSLSEFLSRSLKGQLQDFAHTQKMILEEKGRQITTKLMELAEQSKPNHC
ncbi:MAG: polysaccharide pyruvyl transferase family protein [Nitrospira sp.]|nr:polysaccharide pyruvyl transferase family protein [Nitrospira sp.]